MPYYESVFITRQDISPQQVDGMTERFTTILKENGGDVGKTEYWGLRNLAYRIKKNRKGHYVLMNIDAPSDAIIEMERNMRLDEDLIRVLTIKVDELEETPSIMMQAKQSRDGHRGPRDDRGRPPRDGHRGPRDDRPRPPRDAAPRAKSEQAPKADSAPRAESEQAPKADSAPAEAKSGD